MESESHGHYPVRPKDAVPKPHRDDDSGALEEVDPHFRPPRFSHEPTVEEAASWVGWKVTDELGRSVGKVEDVYAVEGHPEWLLIKHRRNHHFLAPMVEAIAGGEQVFLPYDHGTIESAPEVDPGATPNEFVLARAHKHYETARQSARS